MKVYPDKEYLTLDIFDSITINVMGNNLYTLDTPVVQIVLNCQDVGDSVEMIDWYGYRELRNKEYDLYSSYTLIETTSCRDIAEFLWDNNLVNKSIRFEHNFRGIEDVLTKLYLFTKYDFYGEHTVHSFFQDYGVKMNLQ